ncbi:MAG: NADH-quinone oxidoreductase subunit C [Rhizobiales bacterium]|nr:NADH-quinone oxidoreductase subunit C [Hyphomicrobiales bacterium]MBI3672569.1 NADH-quinone oxidoreductase subunit C [Hyphomicrobiales bacterium]
MAETLQELGAHIAAKLGAAVTGVSVAFGELTVAAQATDIVSVLSFLRDDPECGFVCFTDLCGADYPSRQKRFEVVYHLLAPYRNRRIRVKVEADEDVAVPSVIAVYPAANWYEREVFDLYGVLFADHPDLRRILTDYGFAGHPLRKDFPLTGMVEVRYDDEQKRVVYEPVKLVQEFRSFDYLSPWEGTDYVLPGDEKAK